MEEFEEKQLIAFEKETIGFYFSQHPLSRYQEVVQGITGDDTSTLAERPNGSEVKICGLVSSMKEITTKKGDRMAFVTLEDMKGFIEVILFPEVFKASLTLLRSGEPVILRGTLDLSEEQAGETRIGQQTKAKLIGREVQPLPEPSSQPERTLRVKVPIDALKLERLQDLKEMILGHRGDSRVFLHFVNGAKGETVIALSDQYRVDPSLAFQEDVKRLFESCALS
jgi:DNA polymerase-3 subunit alpha